MTLLYVVAYNILDHFLISQVIIINLFVWFVCITDLHPGNIIYQDSINSNDDDDWTISFVDAGR